MSRDKNRPVVAKRAVASGAPTGKRGRFNAPRKAQAVLRLVRGEDLELLRRELGVMGHSEIRVANTIARQEGCL